MSRIPIKVEQFDDEPAWSVLRRLARLSGTSSVTAFCLDFSLDCHSIESATQLAAFSRQGGYDLAKLKRNSIQSKSRRYEINGEHLRAQGVKSLARMTP